VVNAEDILLALFILSSPFALGLRGLGEG
jgi:hypothetical protein